LIKKHHPHKKTNGHDKISIGNKRGYFFQKLHKKKVEVKLV
jgi:hypothetical protein